MKKLTLLLLALAISGNMLSQKVKSAAYDEMLNKLLSHKAKEISVSEASLLQDIVFIDAREKNEFDISHIKNAVWCGYNDFDPNRLKGVDLTKKIVVYCSVGYRSEKISLKLKKLGFTNNYNLYGGIFEWKNQGNPVYDSNGNPTEKVHAYSSKWAQWLTAGEKVY